MAETYKTLDMDVTLVLLTIVIASSALALMVSSIFVSGKRLSCLKNIKKDDDVFALIDGNTEKVMVLHNNTKERVMKCRDRNGKMINVFYDQVIVKAEKE